MSTLDNIQEAIEGKEQLDPKLLQAIKAAASPVGQVWAQSGPGQSYSLKTKDGQEKPSEEIGGAVQSIKDTIQTSIDALADIGVEIKIGRPQNTGQGISMDTKMFIDGKRIYDYDATSFNRLREIPNYFDSANKVLAYFEERLGVEAGDQKSIDQRDASHAEVKSMTSMMNRNAVKD